MASPDVLDPQAADLMAIGRHCNFAGCSQLDFLPFVCGNCSGTYCLEHRMPTSHSCKHADKNEVCTIICPLCAKAIRLLGKENPDIAFERHSRSGECDPRNYQTVHQKPKCPASGCKEKLAASNKYRCKDCNKDVCLKHRFPADHQCKGKQAPQSSSWQHLLQQSWNATTQQNTHASRQQQSTSNSNSNRRSTGRQAESGVRNATAAKWTEWWKQRMGGK